MPHDSDPKSWRGHWELSPGVTYLNHGSFGPPPEPVKAARRAWQERLDCQPMDFFVRQHEQAWFSARRSLAEFIGADERNLVFVENATAAMNVVADSFPLHADDEIVLTDHEYGAICRIWARAAQRAGAAEPRIAQLPLPIESVDQVLDAVFLATTDRTRLLVVSHITSPTGIILPVQAIVDEADRRGIAVCVDGPHAPAQVTLNLDQLGCNYYCASCHKWLCAPFGSGFLYVAPQHQDEIEPTLLSWGRLLPKTVETWSDEFIWSGTRDPSACLAIPAAIEFFQEVGLASFQAYSHDLAKYARYRLEELTDKKPIIPDSPQWYGSMAQVPLPPGDAVALQQRLWAEYSIEVPVITWNDRRWIRVSCHLYNTREDIDLLIEALKTTSASVQGL